MKVSEMVEGKTYRVEYYTSHHTGRTTTRTLRLARIIRTTTSVVYKFASLRAGAYATVLSPTDFASVEELS